MRDFNCDFQCIMLSYSFYFSIQCVSLIILPIQEVIPEVFDPEIEIALPIATPSNPPKSSRNKADPTKKSSRPVKVIKSPYPDPYPNTA